MRNKNIITSFLFLIFVSISLPSCAVNVSDELLKARMAYSSENFTEAMKIWRKLAEKNTPEALWGIGILYESGKGIEQNSKIAVSWFSKAASLNHAPAQHSMGLALFFGDGIKEDRKKAIEYYMKAANQGHAPAMYLLGLEYEYGDTIEKDLSKAKSLFKKSLELGYKDSARALMRIETLDIQKNLDKTTNEK